MRSTVRSFWLQGTAVRNLQLTVRSLQSAVLLQMVLPGFVDASFMLEIDPKASFLAKPAGNSHFLDLRPLSRLRSFSRRLLDVTLFPTKHK